MKRKQFLNMALFGSLGVGLNSFIPNVGYASPTIGDVIVPPYLKKGDLIGITSPAGYISLEAIGPALAQLRDWGFNVEIGTSIGKREGTFGGSDYERYRDFQYMMDNPNIKAIMCARGGYGFVRIVDRLDFSKFKNSPKWLIGFSDITTLHSHLFAQVGVASIHSKMCNSFPSDALKATDVQKATIDSIKNALMGEKMNYSAQFNPSNRLGEATGYLVGGNLRTLENMAGSVSQMKTEGCILFLEDTGEYLYSVDRMFWNLKRTGMLDDLNGLILGGFKNKEDNPGEEFVKQLEEIVHEKISGRKFPVCFDFPVGHQVNNYALRCGQMHRLTVTVQESRLESF